MFKKKKKKTIKFDENKLLKKRARIGKVLERTSSSTKTLKKTYKSYHQKIMHRTKIDVVLLDFEDLLGKEFTVGPI